MDRQTADWDTEHIFRGYKKGRGEKKERLKERRRENKNYNIPEFD